MTACAIAVERWRFLKGWNKKGFWAEHMNIVESLIKMLMEVGGDGRLAAANYHQKIQLRQETGEGQHSGSDLFLKPDSASVGAAPLLQPCDPTAWHLLHHLPRPQIGKISGANFPILND